MDEAGGSDWLQALQGGFLVMQAILLALSAWWTRATVQEARAARRDEAQRFGSEAGKARTADLERRLDRVLERVAAIDELRMQSTSDKKGIDARYEIGPAKRRLRAAMAGFAFHLPQTGHLLRDDPTFPPSEQIDASLAELENALRDFVRESTGLTS